MSGKKPRNREHRTRATPADSTVSVRVQLPRSAYNQMRELSVIKKFTRADIFMAGIEACSHQ